MLCKEITCQNYSFKEDLCKYHWNRTPEKIEARREYDKKKYKLHSTRIKERQRQEYANLTQLDKRRKNTLVKGITFEQYQALLEKQEFKCAICKSLTSGVKDWNIDHDHKCCSTRKSCGKCVRGLLCMKCNVGLGAFRDNLDFLQAAIDYLQLQEVKS
jgi:hypothetical protein